MLLSTAIIDALKALGALELDEQEHVAAVRRMFNEAIAAPGDVERQQLAATLWASQFDHPFDGAYCQVWNDLEDADRKTLMSMAANATELESWLSGALVASLASLGDPSTAPVIARWATPPSVTAFSLTDAIESFAIAHAGLARLGAALPERKPHGAAEGQIIAAGEIVYWLNRVDLACADRRAACEGALSRLTSGDAAVAADLLIRFGRSRTLFEESTQHLPGGEKAQCNIARAFPEAAGEVFRAVLRRPGGRGYFQNVGENELLSACVSALGGIGTSVDIQLLRAYAAIPRQAAGAMDAIRRLEGVRGEVA